MGSFAIVPQGQIGAIRGLRPPPVRTSTVTGFVASLLCLGGLATLSAAVMDYSAPLQSLDVSQVGGTVTYRVFDPQLGTYAGDNDVTGSVFNLQNRHGVVTWNNGTSVFCRIYDPSQQKWIKTNLAAGTTTDLQTSQGVVAWSGGGVVSQFVYDAVRQTWVGAQISSGTTSDLRTASGMVAWTSGTTVHYQAFDPIRGRWFGASAAAGNSVFDLTTAEGVVAWSAGSVVFFATYDPTRAGWRAQSISSGNTFDLKANGAVVAWSHLNTIYYYAYDPLLGSWQGGSTASGQTFNLSIQNGTVFWNANNVNYTRGYDVHTGLWSGSLSVPFAAFGVSTNAGNAPLKVWFFDLSLGASSWLWNFGDGQISTRRSPYHVFENFAQNLVTLTVAGPGGGNASTNRIIQSDVTPPTGTVVINFGADFTTNALVFLSLAATDNGGLVTGMRFSDDAATWSAWEAFNPSKIWTLPGGNGVKVVFAQFRDPALNEGFPAYDSILLDTTPPPLAFFVMSNLTVLERISSIAVEVQLNHSFSLPVTLECFTSDGSATAGSDYVGTTNLLTFSPGITSRNFTVQILNDSRVELNETLFLHLANPTNALVGPPATLTILDEDPAEVSFQSSQYSAEEGQGFAPIMVHLNAPSGQTVHVRYVATNGTATADLDYVPSMGLIEFLPGQTNQTFFIPLLDDILDELSESVQLRLLDPTNAVLGATVNATLTILDDDRPRVGFVQPQFSTVESDGSVLLRVVLSKPFNETVFVDYGTSNGTAQAGNDYLSTMGTLTFPPNQTNKSFFVNLINDSAPENDETVLVYLSSPVAASLGAFSQARLTILDDDFLRLIEPRYTAAGGFQVTLLGPPGQRVSMDVSVNLRNWITLATLTNLTGRLEFTDPNAATAPTRFYFPRALIP